MDSLALHIRSYHLISNVYFLCLILVPLNHHNEMAAYHRSRMKHVVEAMQLQIVSGSG